MVCFRILGMGFEQKYVFGYEKHSNTLYLPIACACLSNLFSVIFQPFKYEQKYIYLIVTFMLVV